ncbi:MAG: DUF3524 domain-containing protein [Desulfobacteraceae bacterium]|nr:MAG: DUF3524 domain-containing protein [Desulfobacteraceae bacterium]
MHLLFLEPFFGGSHKDFALGLQAHSAHDIELVTLPGIYWKWRMAGAALEFLRQVPHFGRYDGIVVTDMMNLCDLIALAGEPLPSVILYFHENQVTYPVSRHERSSHYLGAVNLSSALAADRVVFNSHYHKDAFLKGVAQFIQKCPDMNFSQRIDDILLKSSVLYPGCFFSKKNGLSWEEKPQPPVIIWNHRWEHDKNPEPFFHALTVIKEKQIPFRLALLGERYPNIPDVFIEARERFSQELVSYEFLESREAYYEWLAKGSIAVSTANQENFGISMVEAARFGAIPLVPDRLSYPEIIPQACHESCVYQSQRDLILKLETILTHPYHYKNISETLAGAMQDFAWSRVIASYDHLFENTFRNL